MSDPTKESREKHADTIIRNHVIWSMGAGFIPVLVADIFAVSALQLDMIRQMCRVYDVNFSETQGKAIVTSLTSSTLARIGAGSLVKLIPGLGSIIGGVTVSVFAGASTYALGEVFKKHFESGGTILDFDPARLRKLYKEKFEKGKKVAEEWRKDGKTQAETQAEKDTPTNVTNTAQPAPPPPPAAAADPGPDPDKMKSDKAILDRLRELADMRDKGIIEQEEFDRMKKKLIDAFDK